VELVDYMLRPSYLSALRFLKNDKDYSALKEINIGVVSNFVFEALEPYIEAELKLAGFRATFYVSNPTSFFNDILSDDTSFFDREFDVLLVLVCPEYLSDLYRFGRANLSEKDEVIRSVKNSESLFLRVIERCFDSVSCPVLISNWRSQGIISFGGSFELKNFGFRLLDGFNRIVDEAVIASERCLLIDIDSVITSVGSARSINQDSSEIRLMPFSNEILHDIAAEISSSCVVAMVGSKKCMVVDCDNTLWGGVVGEDGVDGITISSGLGAETAYERLQRFLKQAKQLGWILVTCSKNNFEDVMEVFDRRSDMILSKDDFVLHDVDWEEKDVRIKRIADQLNIGLSSVVFIDDSDYECACVASNLPGVLVHQFHANAMSFNDLVKRGAFKKAVLVKEDLQKTNLYRAKLEIDRAICGNNDFMFELDIKLTVFEAKSEHVPRVAQLTQKTNQFNVTTKRYSERDIVSFIESGEEVVYCFNVRDRFVDHGLVGVVIGSSSGKVFEIDTLLMSCRVLSRGIEIAILGFLQDKYDQITAGYIPTAKNGLVENLFLDANFTEVCVEDMGTRFLWSTDRNQKLKCPEWISFNFA
jgi:FkbH-like protein